MKNGIGKRPPLELVPAPKYRTTLRAIVLVAICVAAFLGAACALQCRAKPALPPDCPVPGQIYSDDEKRCITPN